MTITWFSKHHPTVRQLAELQRLFGPTIQIIEDNRAFDTADDVVNRFIKSQAHEMVIVAPLSVIRQIVKRGLHPLWAQMEQCTSDHPECEVNLRDRHYRFVKFWRIEALDMIVSDIENPDDIQNTTFNLIDPAYEE